MANILYEQEEIFLKKTKGIIENPPEYTDLLKEYTILSSEYNKLLRQSEKLMHLADGMQLKLMNSNNLVRQKVEELTKAEEQLKKIAITDSLTGILNRRGIYKSLEDEAVRYNRNKCPFSIIIADLDFFKRVNDSFGHISGDYILKTICEKVKNTLRAQDSIGRWGGEEFIILLPNTDRKGAMVLAKKIKDVVENIDFILDDTKIKITTSLGGCVYNETYDLNYCLEMADKALYKSKNMGRNRITFHGYNKSI